MEGQHQGEDVTAAGAAEANYTDHKYVPPSPLCSGDAFQLAATDLNPPIVHSQYVYFDTDVGLDNHKGECEYKYVRKAGNMRVYCFTLHVGAGVEHPMPKALDSVCTLSSITIGHCENCKNSLPKYGWTT